jgi:CcmD family protein
MLHQPPALPATGLQLQQTPSAQKPPEGFEPISEIPPEDRMPAAPMVIAAYAFVMLAFFAYLLSLARRLGAVKQEISRLESELKRSGRT